MTLMCDVLFLSGQREGNEWLVTLRRLSVSSCTQIDVFHWQYLVDISVIFPLRTSAIYSLFVRNWTVMIMVQHAICSLLQLLHSIDLSLPPLLMARVSWGPLGIGMPF